MDLTPHQRHQLTLARLAVARFVATITASLLVGGPAVYDAWNHRNSIDIAATKGLLAGLITYLGMLLLTRALTPPPPTPPPTPIPAPTSIIATATPLEPDTTAETPTDDGTGNEPTDTTTPDSATTT